jgi:exopolyphosphatase/guanosine-5'-triphosphate,3'-diphosphate pyrophosphatase
MSVKTFAAIDVGSFEIAMKIFSFSSRGAMQEVDYIRRQLDLGSDTYASGKISYEKLDELSRVLKEFAEIQKAYKVEDYRACGTSAVRETDNAAILLNQLELRTGISIEVISNSEQRFLNYKSVASKGEIFQKILEDKTAIVDIGGGSTQISLFDQDALVSTQNMELGVLRMQERLNRIKARSTLTESLIDEMASTSLAAYKKLYMKEQDIHTLILLDDYLSLWAVKRTHKDAEKAVIEAEEYDRFLDSLRGKSLSELSQQLDIPVEKVPFLFISGVLVRRLMLMMGATRVWMPGVSLCDGIAYDYGEKKKYLKGEHDFENDILACARNISKRYMGSRKQAGILESIAMSIYDAMKKIHGLGKRERLCLQLAALLQDCGKFITLADEGEAAYHIIMATEIIGLSHREREIVAYVVRYTFNPFNYMEGLAERSLVSDQGAYLTVAKLTAILRLSNSLYRSRKQKFKDVKAVLRDGKLILTVETLEEILLEQEVFQEQGEFFREVFNMETILRQKKFI